MVETPAGVRPGGEGDLEVASREYWAFLSYSHADAAWAAWLLRRLEAYPVPPQLVGRMTAAGPAPRRFRPVFRDREELELSSSLGDRIRDVLDRSKFLIVICSPTAARSRWVNEEVAYFQSVHGRERVMCVIVEGEPFVPAGDAEPWRECFPAALREGSADGGEAALDEQPIAADLRPNGDGRRLAVLKLVAGMMGVGLDTLVHRDARRRQRQLGAVAAASFAGMVAMGGLAAVALAARNEARARKAQAEGLIEFMLVDLRKTLEPEGKLDALDVVGRRAMAYYASQRADRLDADSLGRRSRVLHLIGDVEDQRGDLASALKVFQEAAASTRELLARQPDDPQRIYDHAQSVYWVGYIAWRRGQSREATDRFNEYMRLADRLVAIDPANDEWRAEVGYANSNLGTVLLESGKTTEAVAAFERSLAVNLELVRRKPGDPGRLADLGQGYAWNADARLLRGEFEAAMRYRLAERKIYEAMLAARPTDVTAMQSLIVNRQGVANILIQQRRLPAAIEELRLASGEADALLRSDRDNTQHRERAAPLHITLGQAEMASGQHAAAGRSAEIALDMAQTLVETDPTVVDWSGLQLGGARLLRMRVMAEAAASEAAVIEALAPAPREFARLQQLQAQRPRNFPLARVVAEAAILAGDYCDLTDDRAAAQRFWAQGTATLRAAGAEEPAHAYDRASLLLEVLRTRQSSSLENARQGRASSARYNW